MALVRMLKKGLLSNEFLKTVEWNSGFNWSDGFNIPSHCVCEQRLKERFVFLVAQSHTHRQIWKMCMCYYSEDCMVKFAVSSSHSMLTPGLPFIALTPQHQVFIMSVIRVPVNNSLVWRWHDLNPGILPHLLTYCKVPCKHPLPCKRPPLTSGLKLCKGWCTK